jgi:hypothetical protein
MLPNGNLAFTSGFQGTSPNFFGQSIEVLPNGTKTYVQQMTGLEYRSYFESTLYGPPANLLDPGFEDPILGTGRSAYQADPTGSAWSFSGTAGVAGNGSTITDGNLKAPQGSQVAFLQKTGTISQVVDFPAAGSYQISVSAAQRANNGTSQETVQVLVDGTVVDTFTPASTDYATYTTAAFPVTAGSHTIRFVGVDPTGADSTALLDQVSIDNVAPPPQITGSWFINGNQATQIQQNGSSLTFTNERGKSSPGTFLSSNRVVATAWHNLVGTLVPMVDGIRILWANGTIWDQLQLAGQGVIGSQAVQITQDGNSLTFINENGQSSPGYIADVNHVVATGWGNLVGTLTPTFEGWRINWANGTTWDMLRLTGPWFINGSQPTQVVQPGNGNTLTFINENAVTSAGSIQDNSHVVATGWGNLVGTLVPTALGAQITWSNGTAWDEVDVAGPWFIGNDQPTAIYQDSGGLTLVNERGEISAAYLASDDQIVATGWGDLVGTVVVTSTGRQINWSNGTTWYTPAR